MTDVVGPPAARRAHIYKLSLRLTWDEVVRFFELLDSGVASLSVETYFAGLSGVEGHA